jgi:putative membrane protein
MNPQISDFLIDWGIVSFSLWVASNIFNGLKFESKSSLLVAALMLGFANAVLKPILVVLTFPITILTLGFFYLAINAFIIQIVAYFVKGFKVSGFWTAFFVSIFIAALGAFLELFFPGSTTILIPAGPTITA